MMHARSIAGRFLFATTLLGVGTFTAACGSSGGDSAAVKCPATPSASIATKGAIGFDKSELSATAGKDTFEFVNKSGIAHTFVIKQKDGSPVAGTKATVNADTTKSCAEYTLTAGTYTFYCDIPGHETNMHGTLTVS